MLLLAHFLRETTAAPVIANLSIASSEPIVTSAIFKVAEILDSQWLWREASPKFPSPEFYVAQNAELPTKYCAMVNGPSIAAMAIVLTRIDTPKEVRRSSNSR